MIKNTQDLNNILSVEERELNKLRKEVIAARNDPTKMLSCYKKSLCIITELREDVMKSDMNSVEKVQSYGKSIMNFITEIFAVIEFRVVAKKVLSGKLKTEKAINNALLSAKSYQIAKDPNFNKFTKQIILETMDDDIKKIQACIDALHYITGTSMNTDDRWDIRTMMLTKITNILNTKVSPLVTKAGMNGMFAYSPSSRTIYHTGINPVNNKIPKKIIEDDSYELVPKIQERFSVTIKNIESKFKNSLRDAGIIEIYAKPNTDLTLQLVIVDKSLPVVESFINYCYDMYPAEESISDTFGKIKANLIKLFSKLVLFLQRKVKTMKDGKVKASLLQLLNRANEGLQKSKSLQKYEPEVVKSLKKEADEINDEISHINDSSNIDNGEFLKGNYLEEHIKLTSKIVRGEIKRPQVEKILEQMEEKYGEYCFDTFPVDRKEKPWSKAYLKELELLSGSGASSKEFYLYMSEVSDYVYSHKFFKKK
jgi:hypothetical protein